MNIEKIKVAITGMQEAMFYAENNFDEAFKQATTGYIKVIESELGIIKPVSVEQSVLLHIHSKLAELEKGTGLVSVVQFAVHPKGMAIMLRCYNVNLKTEYPIPDCCMLSEIENNNDAIKRVDVIFDELDKALKQIMIINPNQARKAGI